MKRLSHKKSSVPLSENRRVALMSLVASALLLLLVCRVAFLQIIAHDRYSDAAEGQRLLEKALPSDRGEVFLDDTPEPYPLAVNRQYFLAYAAPRDVADEYRTSNEVAGVLGLSREVVEEKIAKRDDPFEILKHRLSDEEAEKIRQLNLPGIRLLPETFRYYPGNSLASQTIGFMGMRGNDYRGQYGVESSFEESLRGSDGIVSTERDAAGGWIPFASREMVEPLHGHDIVLSIRRVIQYEAEKILREAVENFHADGGSLLVMDPKTGKLLAMASLPNFNPNEYPSVEDPSVFLNPAVSLPYEPGSVLKPITMAIGIDDGKVNANTEYVDTGLVKEAGYDIRNAEDKVYGRATMTKVLEDSINTGVIFVERQVGNERFREYLRRFGFGEKTGIELPAEVSGNLRHLKNTRRSIEFFTASFGQGISVTPLQLLNSYATIANGGVLLKPEITERIIAPDGTVIEAQPETVRRVVSEATANEVGKMLRSVVVNGHGKRADVPAYLVVGKTGTAQVAKPGGGYEEDTSIGSFAGYAPLNDPKFAVLVKIDHPRDVEWAESSAAPTFGKMMKFLLEYARIPPTESVP